MYEDVQIWRQESACIPNESISGPQRKTVATAGLGLYKHPYGPMLTNSAHECHMNISDLDELFNRSLKQAAA